MIVYKWTRCNSVFIASFLANQDANKEKKKSLRMNLFYSTLYFFLIGNIKG